MPAPNPTPPSRLASSPTCSTDLDAAGPHHRSPAPPRLRRRTSGHEAPPSSAPPAHRAHAPLAPAVTVSTAALRPCPARPNLLPARPDGARRRPRLRPLRPAPNLVVPSQARAHRSPVACPASSLVIVSLGPRLCRLARGRSVPAAAFDDPLLPSLSLCHAALLLPRVHPARPQLRPSAPASFAGDGRPASPAEAAVAL
nr:vegetative cell wall protein gp1-like [Aegilops tauschii subsp. strangulata]